MNKKQLPIFCIVINLLGVYAVSADTSKLLGFEQMINELDQIIATDKTYFKRHKKDGSPKYLHQIQQRVYTMTYSETGDFELEMQPEEWFSVDKLTNNEFAVRVLDPQKMWEQHVFEPFTIQWLITEIID